MATRVNVFYEKEKKGTDLLMRRDVYGKSFLFSSENNLSVKGKFASVSYAQDLKRIILGVQPHCWLDENTQLVGLIVDLDLKDNEGTEDELKLVKYVVLRKEAVKERRIGPKIATKKPKM